MTPKSPPTVVVMVVRPSRSPGHFDAHLADGSELCRSGRQPLLDGARELARRGFDPATPLVMRHVGSQLDALQVNGRGCGAADGRGQRKPPSPPPLPSAPHSPARRAVGPQTASNATTARGQP